MIFGSLHSDVSMKMTPRLYDDDKRKRASRPRTVTFGRQYSYMAVGKIWVTDVDGR